MFDSKEIAYRALALAKRRTALKRKRIKIAVSASSICAAFLFCLVTLYTLNIFDIESPDYSNGEEWISINDNEIPLQGFFFPPEEYTGAEPIFIIPDGDIIFAGSKLEFELINPEENTCYLDFEIVLADTGETLYKSYLIAPGLRNENIILSKLLEPGIHKAVLVIYAYDLYNINVISTEYADFNLLVE